jgi:hypothetical protein
LWLCADEVFGRLNSIARTPGVIERARRAISSWVITPGADCANDELTELSANHAKSFGELQKP